MENMNLPVKFDDHWGSAVAPIRKGISQRYLVKAKKAIEAGLYDAAVNYTWDLVVNDLRLKVEAFGVDIFISVLDNVKYHENGDSLHDRWKDIQDSTLLNGCLQLSLISRTAFRHLSFCLSIRNHESAAHPIDDEGELDFETTIFVIRESVKFVLAQDMPDPGFNLKTLSENLKNRDLEPEKDILIKQLQHLSSIQCDNALGIMVSMYIEGEQQTQTNILILIRSIWRMASEEAKDKVGRKYARLSTEGELEKRNQLLSLLMFVDGIGAIPNTFRRSIFDGASKRLIKAHFGWDNFEKETAPARQLNDLGVDCPDESLSLFTSAFVVSYIGNFFGESRGAIRYLNELKKKFSLRHWESIISSVRNSDHVRSEMYSSRPYARLQGLCTEMLPLLVKARDKEDCEFIIKHQKNEARERFEKDD